MENFPRLRFISTIQMDHFDTDDFDYPQDGSARSSMLGWFKVEVEQFRDLLHEFEQAPLATLTVRKNLSVLLNSAWTVSSTCAVIKELHTGLRGTGEAFDALALIANDLLDVSRVNDDLDRMACLDASKRLIPLLTAIATRVSEGR